MVHKIIDKSIELNFIKSVLYKFRKREKIHETFDEIVPSVAYSIMYLM